MKENYKKILYKRLFNFSLDCIKLSEKLKENKKPWPLADQLIRSGTSIGANIIEAKSASSKKDFIKFYQIALKSSNETTYWLLLINNSYLEFKKISAKLIKESEEISKIIAKSVITLKNKKDI